MNNWTDTEINFLKQQYGKMSYKDISVILGRTAAAIGCKVTDLCIADDKFWNKKDLKILIDNYHIKTPKKIQELFPNRKWTNIRKKANNLGLKLRSKSMSKILGDTSILMTDSVELYYWVGFILSDGHIPKNNRLRITLSNIDKEHLNKFRKFLKLPKKSLKEVGNKFVSLAVMDNHYIDIFKKKFDISPTKTYNPPDLDFYKNLPDSLFWSLVIGFIDGDGCIKIRNYSNKMCLISVKNYKTWQYFHQMILDRLSLKFNHNSKVNFTENKYSYICISQNKIIKFLKQQCINLNLPYLKRKWDKIDLNFISRGEKI